MVVKRDHLADSTNPLMVVNMVKGQSAYIIHSRVYHPLHKSFHLFEIPNLVENQNLKLRRNFIVTLLQNSAHQKQAMTRGFYDYIY